MSCILVFHVTHYEMQVPNNMIYSYFEEKSKSVPNAEHISCFLKMGYNTISKLQTFVILNHEKSSALPRAHRFHNSYVLSEEILLIYIILVKMLCSPKENVLY
jgi:hypothetical protein